MLLLTAIAFTLSTGFAAPANLPTPDSYGFNWLQPNSQCKKISAKEMEKFKTCHVETHTFGLNISAYQCNTSTKKELIIYKTAAQCQQALETMQANAP